MKIGNVLAVLAVLGLATPLLAATVQFENWDGPFTQEGACGDLDSTWNNQGYGPPAAFSGDATIKNEGAYSQRWNVPGSAFNTNPTGSAVIVVDPHATWFDFSTLVQSLGGPAPDTSKPAQVTMDIRIDVDSIDDYDRMDLALDVFGAGTGKVVHEFNPLTNSAHTTGVWHDDFVCVEWTAAPAGNILFAVFENFVINNPFAGNADYYIDDIKITYNIPEPGSVLLIGLGALALLRRRR